MFNNVLIIYSIYPPHPHNPPYSPKTTCVLLPPNYPLIKYRNTPIFPHNFIILFYYCFITIFLVFSPCVLSPVLLAMTVFAAFWSCVGICVGICWGVYGVCCIFYKYFFCVCAVLGYIGLCKICKTPVNTRFSNPHTTQKGEHPHPCWSCVGTCVGRFWWAWFLFWCMYGGMHFPMVVWYCMGVFGAC